MVVTLILLFALGMALTALGLRGRCTDDHPLCRRCGFDLTGRAPDSTRCPECGADLKRPKSMVLGYRRRRAGLLTGGIAVWSAAVSVFGVVAYGRTKHVEWLSYAPLWYTLREASSIDPTRRKPALAELRARFAGGRLSKMDVGRFADAGLAYQADGTKPWDPTWGDLLENAQASGDLSADRRARYAKQAMMSVLSARARAPASGEEIPSQSKSTFDRRGSDRAACPVN